MSDEDLGLIPYLLISTILLLLLTTFLLRSYAHISVPLHAKAIVWISWTLCFSIVYILPIDLRPHIGHKRTIAQCRQTEHCLLHCRRHRNHYRIHILAPCHRLWPSLSSRSAPSVWQPVGLILCHYDDGLRSH